jgi:hypothetical protein
MFYHISGVLLRGYCRITAGLEFFSELLLNVKYFTGLAEGKWGQSGKKTRTKCAIDPPIIYFMPERDYVPENEKMNVSIWASFRKKSCPLLIYTWKYVFCRIFLKN